MAEVEEIAQQLAPVAVPDEPAFSPHQIYLNFTSEICSWWNISKAHAERLRGWEQRSARCITDFKKDYILSIGDLMNRSICMAIAGGLTYKLISFNKPSLLGRTRNLGISFLANGWLFVPELFNPFLPKAD